MGDPRTVLQALDDAEDAFEYRRGAPEYETDISQDSDWKTQLTKACRYVASCETLRSEDGYNGAVVELSFGAIERTIEAYLLWNTDEELEEFQDHEYAYDRAHERGLFERETVERLKELYSSNRTDHYYGGIVPTQDKEEYTFELAKAVHSHTVEQVREGGVCVCS